MISTTRISAATQLGDILYAVLVTADGRLPTPRMKSSSLSSHVQREREDQDALRSVASDFLDKSDDFVAHAGEKHVANRTLRASVASSCKSSSPGRETSAARGGCSAEPAKEDYPLPMPGVQPRHPDGVLPPNGCTACPRIRLP
jgi:hypothetical protein